MERDTSINTLLPDCQGVYMNIAAIFNNMASNMKKELGNARGLESTITMADIEEMFATLENLINNSLSQVTKQRIVIELGKNYENVSDKVYMPYRNNNTKNTNESMNKKVIRLTEGDIHRIVKESVNKVLTELDWRTYANAAKKSREQASNDWDMAENDPKNYNHYYDYDKHSTRASDFSRASAEMLDKQYGGRHSVNTDDSHIQRFQRYPNSEIDVSHFAHRPMKGYEEDWPPYATTTRDNYHIGNKEISDFVNGKSKYIKGKGWQ